MSWIVSWQGREYDVDPTEFTGRELKQIKILTGLTYKGLVGAIGQLDGEAISILFWTVDRRSVADLKFSDYDGPPLRLVIEALPGFNAAMEDLGKAMGTEEETPTTETSGGPSSPSSTPDSQTETSTTG